jgi:hypothetical protein
MPSAAPHATTQVTLTATLDLPWVKRTVRLPITVQSLQFAAYVRVSGHTPHPGLLSNAVQEHAVQLIPTIRLVSLAGRHAVGRAD